VELVQASKGAPIGVQKQLGAGSRIDFIAPHPASCHDPESLLQGLRDQFLGGETKPPARLYQRKAEPGGTIVCPVDHLGAGEAVGIPEVEGEVE
jgi:hypothetical protein